MPNLIVEYAHRYRKGETGQMTKEKWLDWTSKTNASLHYKIIREFNAQEGGNVVQNVVEPPEAVEAIENSKIKKK